MVPRQKGLTRRPELPRVIYEFRGMVFLLSYLTNLEVFLDLPVLRVSVSTSENCMLRVEACRGPFRSCPNGQRFPQTLLRASCLATSPILEPPRPVYPACALKHLHRGLSGAVDRLSRRTGSWPGPHVLDRPPGAH